MLAAWPLLDPSDLDNTISRWLDITVPLIQAQRTQSSALAANYLTTFRALELGVSAANFTPALAEPAADEAIRTSLTIAGPARIRTQSANGSQLGAVVAVAQRETAREAIRHVLGGGRGTVLNSTRSDRRALGWARATSGSPCHFCAMLASRGPVYGDDTGDFAAHAGCSCTAEPVYRDNTDWPPGSRRYQQQWDDAKELARSEQIDTTVAFRRLHEGRANPTA